MRAPGPRTGRPARSVDLARSCDGGRRTVGSCEQRRWPSKLASRKGRRDRVAAYVGRRSSPGVSRAARSSIVGEASIPTASPAGPTTRPKSRVKLPGPQATSRTPSPGHRPSSSRAMRCSSPMPAAVTPLATRPMPGATSARRSTGSMRVSMRSWASPVEAGASPAPRRSSHPRGAGARRSAGSASSATARSMPAGLPRRYVVARAARGVQRGQRHDALLVGGAADLAGEAQRPQAGDLALALDPGRVILRQARDQPGDAVAELQREVRRRGAHELADVLDRDLVAGGLADGALGFAHGLLDCAWLVGPS